MYWVEHIKPATLRELIHKLNKGLQKGLTKLRLGLGRSPQMELQRDGRAPLQPDDKPPRTVDQLHQRTEWCCVFPRSTVYHLPILYSEHAPILTILQSTARKNCKPFHFENWWLLEQDFQQIASGSWRSTNAKPFHCRTSKLSKDLKLWCKKKKPIHEQLSKIEEQLTVLQSKHPAHRNHSHEAILSYQHQQILEKNAEYHRQRVKKEWICKGDRNTGFFHQAIMKRARQNRISFLMDEQGNPKSLPEDIAQVFIRYFNNLFTSQLQGMPTQQQTQTQVQITDVYTLSLQPCRKYSIYSSK